MQMIDLFSDLIILFSGMLCMGYVTRKRRCFDLWASIPVCGAWIVKGIRCFYFDWFITAINSLDAAQILSFVAKAHRTLGVLDVLVEILLCAAFLRFVNHSFYQFRYNQEIKSFRK